MPTVDILPESYGMNLVRNVGFQLRTLVGTLDFDSSYSSGGEAFDVSRYFDKEIVGVMVFPKDGYIFEYDEANKKIKAYQPADSVLHNSGDTHTVTDEDSPDGNAVYVNVDDEGNIYLESNIANDEEDKEIQFGGSGDPVLTIRHVASPDGDQVYFDDDGSQPDRLLADIEKDLYVPTDTPGYFMKVKADGSADSNGEALNYDDDTDDRLECETANNGDADLELSKNIVPAMKEVQEGVDLSDVTGVRFLALGY